MATIADVLDRFRVPINARERVNRRGTVPYYGATGQVGWIDDNLFDEELVLLGEDGAPFLERNKAKAYLISGPSWVNNHAHVLRGRGGVCMNRYLLHYLNHFDYRDHVNGTTRLKLTQGEMNRIPVPLAPINEQKRIVAVIEEQVSRLDAGAKAVESVRKNLTRLRATWLQGVVLGRFTRDRSPSPAGGVGGSGQRIAGRLDSLPPLPDRWSWASLGDVIAKGPQNGLYLPRSRYGSGDAILRITDFQDGWVRPRCDLNLVAADAYAAKTFALHPNDLVINRVNSMSHLGKSTVVGDAFDGVLFESNMMRVRLRPTLLPRFADMYLRTTLGRSLLVKNSKQAVNQASINQDDVRATPVPIPPTEVQRTIVGLWDRAISLTAALEAHLAASLRRTEVLRAVILRDAFDGLLVDQDTNDEPASVLLERITTERASSNGHNPTKARGQHRRTTTV